MVKLTQIALVIGFVVSLPVNATDATRVFGKPLQVSASSNLLTSGDFEGNNFNWQLSSSLDSVILEDTERKNHYLHTENGASANQPITLTPGKRYDISFDSMVKKPKMDAAAQIIHLEPGKPEEILISEVSNYNEPHRYKFTYTAPENTNYLRLRLQGVNNTGEITEADFDNVRVEESLVAGDNIIENGEFNGANVPQIPSPWIQSNPGSNNPSTVVDENNNYYIVASDGENVQQFVSMKPNTTYLVEAMVDVKGSQAHIEFGTTGAGTFVADVNEPLDQQPTGAYLFSKMITTGDLESHGGFISGYMIRLSAGYNDSEAKFDKIVVKELQ